MAVLVAPNVVQGPSIDPSVLKMATFEIKKANAGDTFDIAPFQAGLPNPMTTPRLGLFVGSTVNVRGTVTINGTVITLPAGLTNDSGYVVLLGT